MNAYIGLIQGRIMKITTIAAGLAAVTIATSATAQSEIWRTMPDGFKIAYSPTLDGCFAELVTDAGYVVHMGTASGLYSGDRSRSSGFLAVYTPEDLGPDHAGSESQVDVLVNGKDYQMSALGTNSSGYSGGYVIGDRNTLVEDVLKMRTMTIITPTNRITINAGSLDIPAALEQVRNCQERRGS